MRVGAGATDRMIALQALRAGLTGLEFFIGIPGSLGGAVRMNAGAFGGETAEVVERVTALDPAGKRHELRPAELGFGYRHSALPEGWIAPDPSRGEADRLDFEAVLMAGLARDGGLYVPESWPQIGAGEIARLAGAGVAATPLVAPAGRRRCP